MDLLSWLAPPAGIITGLAIALYLRHHPKGETR